ncbi:hypothetical protein SJAG_00791 [Schizosaccharomyces japonicus yFS275]|uniref:BSD domain-containing protein n=1 Tax=Schizosaccharomyces japonicus (strain yFS275 / FY16936) TaxID=402676 RepID=B6JWL4_SCHJY|nr:hypothetical protein SJAG_00791 [Schizosaccharomyces japonicus yFS275]EEB05765.2 hypothetical protein SJAG_00791 [Schizosaccharomyces japonicus yFS275]
MDLYEFIGPGAINETTEPTTSESGGEELKKEVQSALNTITDGKFGTFWNSFMKKSEHIWEETRKDLNTATTKASAEVANWKKQISESSQKPLENLRSMENKAGQYWTNLGAKMSNLLDRAIKVSPENETRGSSPAVSIYTTRRERLLDSVANNTELLKDGMTDNTEFTTWIKDFSVEEKTDEIASLLQQYPGLRKSMESLVPETVDYSSFWARYFFHKTRIEEDCNRHEAARSLSADTKRVEEDEIFNWDDEPETETGDKNELQKSTTDKKKSGTGDETAAEEKDVKGTTEKKADAQSADSKPEKPVKGKAAEHKQNENDDDEDDDWE